jgi:ubiquitin carboxyl-terminal hydrolase 9/13
MLILELFQGNTHQDAHEFLNYLLNDVVESVDRYEKSRSSSPENNSRWVHELFEGILTSETKCLTCENLTTRDEVFLDLSIDIEKNSSVSACLRQFSASEMLCERNKFHCDICGGLQEAEKRFVVFSWMLLTFRMKIKKSPKILALHLKRFKYTEDMQRNVKLFHRVVYPPTLRLFNTTDDIEDPDRLYELYAVVVHIGGGPYHGHYVTVVKNDETGNWMLIDDEAVEAVDDGFVGRFYGDRPGMASAYVLFYQEVAQKPIEPVDAMFIPNGKHIKEVPNGIATNEKRPVNGYSPKSDQLAPVPSSPTTSGILTQISSLVTVEEKPSPQITQQRTPPTSPTPVPQAPGTPAAPLNTPLSKSSTLERTLTKKELKDAAKREKEERKREKEETKQREGKKLGRGLGTIKRWAKDKDKDKS